MNPQPKCILHPDTIGVEPLNIPCAPGGKLWLCPACAARYKLDPDTVLRETFEAYMAKHPKRIGFFKTPGNPNN